MAASAGARSRRGTAVISRPCISGPSSAPRPPRCPASYVYPDYIARSVCAGAPTSAQTAPAASAAGACGGVAAVGLLASSLAYSPALSVCDSIKARWSASPSDGASRSEPREAFPSTVSVSLGTGVAES
jgi:hypothetical protein